MRAAGCIQAFIVALSLSCGDSGEPEKEADGRLQLKAHGLVERGSTIFVEVGREGEEPLAPGSVEWIVEPDGAAVALGDDRFLLVNVGAVTLFATLDDAAGEIRLDVTSPPAVVFQRRVDRAWRIYSVDLDGENLERLVEHGDGREPTSEAGSVVFVSDREAVPALYSLSLDGDGLERISDLDAEYGQPALDSTRGALAFVRLVDGIPKVFVAEEDGGDSRRLTSGLGGPGTVEASPSFSDDGSRVVLSATPGTTPDLFVVDVSTGEAAPLITGAATHIEPAWCPCGGHIAFAADIDERRRLDLYLLDLETKEVERLTERETLDAQPAWLSDGRLVFSAGSGGWWGLEWTDPFDPSEIHSIPTGEESSRGPAELR